jgi:MoxR-like ATPase
VHVSDSLVDYLLRIAAATRQNPSIALGLSTRAMLAFTWAARIEAAARGGEFVTPDDVKAIAPAVMAHRLVLSPDAALDNLTADSLVERVLGQVEVPR